MEDLVTWILTVPMRHLYALFYRMGVLEISAKNGSRSERSIDGLADLPSHH